jgi:hypothetical protein
MIPCYGYGSKPACMDGGDEEKELLERLKDTVKKSLRRKNSGPVFPLQKSLFRIESKGLDGIATGANVRFQPPQTEKSSDSRASTVSIVSCSPRGQI